MEVCCQESKCWLIPSHGRVSVFLCVRLKVSCCVWQPIFCEPFTSIGHTQNSKGWTGLSCLFTSNLRNSILLCPVCTNKYTQTHTDIATQTDRTLSVTEVTVQLGWMLSLSLSFLSFCHSLPHSRAEAMFVCPCRRKWITHTLYVVLRLIESLAEYRWTRRWRDAWKRQLDVMTEGGKRGEI